ncbi:hypothetical protein [Erysipelothrix aquatica]|uniref:hypothetical protein n=1 Tax=Erysipelothrix aquatica TaxID=2683714 RepID=UPI001359901A|nr:hypothetical protein [Erysipelothrix aquatica]
MKHKKGISIVVIGIILLLASFYLNIFSNVDLLSFILMWIAIYIIFMGLILRE